MNLLRVVISGLILAANAKFTLCCGEVFAQLEMFREKIYCQGALLHVVQMAKLYEDSKTFVDMKMRFSADRILENFEEFLSKCNNTPTRLETKVFVEANFEPAGEEFEQWTPKDWVEFPKIIDRVRDKKYKSWIYNLNKIWKVLGRKLKDDVQSNLEMYSIIWVPNPFIVPGGRFREFYYWDSYWIVKGLLHSEMFATVKGMLENFSYIVDKFGLIPNGGRVYYLSRSQPPMFIPMVKAYVDATKDFDFVFNHISLMEKEFSYWMQNHTVNVTLDEKNYTLAIYKDVSSGPRPESYSEDMDTASHFNDQEDKDNHFADLKAAAESGWDFSSRWFINNGTNEGNLTSIRTRAILPVDLNALIYRNALILSEFHQMLGNTERASVYLRISEEWKTAIKMVLWHEETGIWLDYDLQNHVKRDYFYPSNLAPLWTQCYDEEDKEKTVEMVLDYLKGKHVLDYLGGIPSSTKHTGEQWDYPNAWPPSQHMIIMGLYNTGNAIAMKEAEKLAAKWVASNYQAYNKTQAMYEKYDATISGAYGGGGEYKVQLGFGWTNGVIMDLIDKFYTDL